MDDIGGIKVSEGLFGEMFKGILPSTIKPSLENNILTVKITEAEFLELAMKGVDQRLRSAMTLRIKEGYIEITVKVI